MRVTILHTNDIHGRVEGLARVATLVERIREETPHRVIYADAGDVEETTTRLSNLTKGVAMHRLLSAAGCEVSVVGNAVWLRYGPQVVADQARAATYPLLLANLSPVEGVQPTALIDGIGFVGVTDPFHSFLGTGVYGIDVTDEVEALRRGARDLRAQGAELVVCLSHLGYAVEADSYPSALDPELAEQVQGEVDLIIGAHTHHLLPEGDRVGSVTIAQAGCFAEHLGRIDVVDGEIRVSVIEVGEDVPPHPAVLTAIEAAEADLDASLDEVLADLDEPLDAQWIAEMLRERMDAVVGLATSAVVLDEPLPAGPLRRRDLWEVCHSTANPAVVELTGAQLAHMIERGNDAQSSRRRTTRCAAGRAGRSMSRALRAASTPSAPTSSPRPTTSSSDTGALSGRLAALHPLRLPHDHPRGGRGATRARRGERYSDSMSARSSASFSPRSSSRSPRSMRASSSRTSGASSSGLNGFVT